MDIANSYKIRINNSKDNSRFFNLNLPTTSKARRIKCFKSLMQISNNCTRNKEKKYKSFVRESTPLKHNLPKGSRNSGRSIGSLEICISKQPLRRRASIIARAAPFTNP